MTSHQPQVTFWLPPELHLIILEHIRDENTLHACALVCRSWVRPSRACSSLSCDLFTDKDSTDYFLSLILSSSLCTIVPALKFITFDIDYATRSPPASTAEGYASSLSLPEIIAMFSMRGACPTSLVIQDPGPVQIVLDALGASVRHLKLRVGGDSE